MQYGFDYDSIYDPFDYDTHCDDDYEYDAVYESEEAARIAEDDKFYALYVFSELVQRYVGR